MVSVPGDKRSGHVGIVSLALIIGHGALAPVPATPLVAFANLVEDAITAWH